MSRPSRRRRVAQAPRIEPLEARIVLGYFSGDNLDEVPPPVFRTECPTCTAPVQVGPATTSPVAFSTQPTSSTTERPVRHFDGLPVLFTADLHASVSPYLNFGQTRSWSGLNNSGPVGNGWAINELPYVVVAGGTNGVDDPGDPGPPGSGVAPGTEDDDRLTVVAGGTTAYTFTVDPQLPYGGYGAWGPEALRLAWAPDPSPALRLTDPMGNVTEFHDVRRDAGGRPVFGSMAEDLPRKYGRFKGSTAADGLSRIQADYDAAGFLSSILVTHAAVGWGRLSYAYDTLTNDLVTAAAADPARLLASVTLERPDLAGGWAPVQRATYTYYTGRLPDGTGGWINDPNGRLGDLQFVRVENAAGTGGALAWHEVDAAYYRYYKFTGESNQLASKGPTNNAATTGGPSPIQPAFGTYDPNNPGPYDRLVFSGIKTVVAGASFARMAAAVPGFLTATDAALGPYVDHFFTYERWADHVGADGNPERYGSDNWNSNVNYEWRTGYRMGSRYRVVEEVAQGAGCSACTGGQGTYRYEYAAHNRGLGEFVGYHSIEPNVWAMKTTEYLPGGGPLWGDHDRRVTYTNEVGQPLLSVFVAVAGPSLAVQDMDIDWWYGSNTITVTVPGHPFQTGDRVAFAGVLPRLYNGVFTATRFDADTFTFRLPRNYFSNPFYNMPAPDPHINQTVGGVPLVTTVTAVASERATYYRYDDRGRLVLQAEPSAVTGYDDEYAELVRDDFGNFTYLRDHAGLIRTYEYYASTTAIGAATLADAGFEVPEAGPNGDNWSFIYTPTGTAWAYAGYAGVAADGSGFTAGNPPAPEGDQVGVLQMDGVISQAVAVAAAGTYRLSFKAARRGNHSGDHDFRVLVDGVEAARFTSTSTSYVDRSVTFTLAAGTRTIALQGLNSAGGDNTSLLDDLRLEVVPATLADAGFEVPEAGPNGDNWSFIYTPTGTAWAYAGYAGVAADGSGFTASNPPAPEGDQVGVLQMDGVISQAVAVAAAAAGTYRLSFKAAQRGNYQLGGYHDFAVTVDGVEVARFQPSGTAYEALHVDLTLAAGTRTIAFAGLNTAGGDNTSFLDDVRLEVVALASGGGGVAGLLRASYVRRGAAGTPVIQRALTYHVHAAGGATVHRVATDTVFGRDHGTAADFADRDPRATTYTYALFPGTTRVRSLTVAAPAVAAARNGPGTAELTTTVLDLHGRPIWARDGDGFLHHVAYDPVTGAVIKQVIDVDTTRTGDFTWLPDGWSTPAGGGLHLITATEVDGLGRTVRQVDPAGTVTWLVYNDAALEVRVYRGWDAATGTATGPTEVRREYRPAPGAPVGERAVYFEALTLDIAPTVDPLTGAPTGQEAITAGAIRGLRREITNPGGQVIESLAYFSMAGLTYATATARLGTASNDSAAGHYHATAHGYDHRGRPGRALAPTGTITRTVFDALGRVVAVWIGTDDTGATDANPAGAGGPNNMSLVQTYEYDGGGIGDGNLTRITAFPGGGAAPRVTDFAHDWRNRLVATKAGVEAAEDPGTNRPLTVYALDNLGAVTAVAVYDGDGVPLGTTPPAASLLRASAAIHHDERGRVYRTEQFAVDPSTGAVSTHALTTDLWYGRRGQVVKVAEPGGPVTKTAHDGAGRPIVAYRTDGGGDASWADALNVVGDVVLSQVETAHDANGNPILVTTRDRFHDNAPGATGPLGTPTAGNRARVSSVASYHDAADRLVAVVAVGTHGGAAHARPTAVPTRSDTALVTSYTYDAGGRVETITDPRGRVTHLVHDLLGRPTRVIEAYTDGVPTATTNKRVESTYDGIGNLLTLKVALPGGGRQTTGYVHGVAPASGSALASNDLLAAVRRPDKATGLPSAAEAETFTSNALGERTAATDRNGTTHAYTHDVLGRLVADAVTTLGSGVAGAVRRLETAYDVAGRPILLTSLDAAAGGNVVNQVRRDYNGLGQLVAEYQAHAGAVDTGTTPRVAYAYSAMAGGANHSRPVSLTYPDGRVLHSGYAAGPDDAIGRVTSLADDDGFGGPGQILEQYDYLGLGTIVARSRPETGIALSYVKRPGEPDGDAGDPYTGLDRFGRVVDQRWLQSATGTAVDRHGYGHDRGGNRLYRANRLDAAFDELYAYDATNQLSSFARGVLSDADNDGVLDTVTSPSRTRSWDLDALGNWDAVTTDGIAEARAHNAQNQLTGVGSTILAYDANGNLTTDEAGRTLTYDAWGRLVAVAGPGSTPLVAYSYDALGRRITANDGVAMEFYHSADWQVLEERAAGSTEVQYVWSLAYVDALVLRDRDADGLGGLEERLYVQQDANWNVTALVDAGGVVVERYAYDPYGAAEVLAADGTARGASDYAWVHLHQGGRYDGAADQYHFRNRDLAPALGRWTREDPIGHEAGDSNLYRYALNSPTIYVDPSGLISFWSGVGNFVVGVAVGVAGAAVVGGLAIGAVTIGAPVALVTGSVLLIGATGLYFTGRDILYNYQCGDWDGLAYNAGSLAGGALVGVPLGGRMPGAIHRPSWSWGRQVADRYRPGRGSVGRWLETGGNHEAYSACLVGAGAGSATGGRNLWITR